jgi:hypothetical protein
MKNVSGWMTHRTDASEYAVLSSMRASRDAAIRRGMGSSEMAALSEADVGLDTLRGELDALLRDLATLPRLGPREQRLLRVGLMSFVDRTVASVLRESGKDMGEYAPGAQVACTIALHRLRANVSLWDDLTTQRRADQLSSIAWEVVRMVGSATLGAVVARLLV